MFYKATLKADLSFGFTGSSVLVPHSAVSACPSSAFLGIGLKAGHLPQGECPYKSFIYT